MGNARVDDSQLDTSDAGIIPNALCDIFKIIASKRASALPGQSWNVIASFMEVYNEQVYDLLEATDKVLSVREDTERGVVEVAGRTKRTVNSAEEVLELLHLGNTNRKTEATMANQVSSRSHAILQLAVESNHRNSSGQEVSTSSMLSLIDLAGSERASATNNRGSRLQEGANINKSLLALANCINALAGNSNTGKQLNVKYRDSKLTHLLKSSLQGKCKLVMIANINPSHITFEDSHNSLKYANRAKNIKVNPLVMSEVNKDSSWIERETKLMAENAELRARIAELEAVISTLQSVNAVVHDDFDLNEQDDVIDCSMDCSLINCSAGNTSLPVICDIPPIKSSKTPQIQGSGSKRTPFSERQRQLCNESREELVDYVESNCSLTKDENERSSKSRSNVVEEISKKRGVDSKTSSLECNKRVKLEPMSTSLKDRIAELSKITLEQQQMVNELLHDENLIDHVNNKDPNTSNFKTGTISLDSSGLEGTVHNIQPSIEECQNIKEVVSLVDIVVEEREPEAKRQSPVQMIFCDEDPDKQDQREQAPRKRRRNSLIPKKTTETEKKQIALTERKSDNANISSDNSTGAGALLSKVMKNIPMTRAAKRRMSIAGNQMTENQPVDQPTNDKNERRKSLRPLRSSNRRNSTVSAVNRGMRNL